MNIIGTASDAHLAGWTLQYIGGPAHTWTTIATGNSNVVGGLLAAWNTSALPRCSYALRLVVSDAANVSCVTSNTAEYLVALTIGCSADADGNNAVSVNDLFTFLADWFAQNGSCP